MTFAKKLNSVSNRHHTSQIFDDFLQMAVCAFSMQRSEDIYLEIAKKYNKEELKGFGEALGALIYDHEDNNKDGWNDYLGNYFEEYGQSNAKTGQFFTPPSICNLMAQFTDEKRENGIVNDCSCGSSRNLIAHNYLNQNNRFNFFYFGQDLDNRCCLMSVLNFVMFGMKGVIINMNTLTLEIYKGWRIYLPETGMGVMPLTIEQCKHYVFEQKEEPKTEPVELIRKATFEQLQLF